MNEGIQFWGLTSNRGSEKERKQPQEGGGTARVAGGEQDHIPRRRK